MNRRCTYLLVVLSTLYLGCATSGELDPGPDGVTSDVDSPPTDDFCEATDPRPDAIEIAPTPEAGEAPYVDALDTATESIRVQVYLMGYGGILDRLIAKAQAGLDVRVILDQSKQPTNQKYLDQLAAAGAQVKWSDPAFTYTHSKYFVVDGRVAVLSTGNYSKSYSIDLERNFAATDRDPADVADLVSLFDADWNAEVPVLDCTRLIVSPINARDRILELIGGAQSTLTIESMQFADSRVRAAVKERVEAGVAVRALLADANWIGANASAAAYLADLGVQAKWIPHLHTKALVVDGVRAYVGSENLSTTSLDRNREVGVIVTEDSSIAPIAATFEKDWAAGTSF